MFKVLDKLSFCHQSSNSSLTHLITESVLAFQTALGLKGNLRKLKAQSLFLVFLLSNYAETHHIGASGGVWATELSQAYWPIQTSKHLAHILTVELGIRGPKF